MSVAGVCSIPGTMGEMYANLAKAYDEASKVYGLPDDVILYLQGMSDQYRFLAEEDKAEVPLRDCVEHGEYDR